MIAKASMNRRIIELEYELKKTKAKLAKAVTGAPMLPPCRMSKKDKQAAAKDILSKYFSEAQISYLIDYKGRESNGMGECGEGDEVRTTTRYDLTNIIHYWYLVFARYLVFAQ